MKPRVLDVSRLPTVAFGAADPLWWSMHLLNVIEGSMLVLLAVAYGYVEARTSPWPPELADVSIGWLATVELGLLVASGPPMWIAGRAAIRGDLRGMRRWLCAATALGLGALVLRWMIFDRLPFRWDVSAYASVVWTMLGVQTFHLITGVGENLLFAILLFEGPVEDARRTDLHASTLLWYFVIVGAALQWAVVFLEILREGAG